MLKKSSLAVLASSGTLGAHGTRPLTVLRAFTNVPRLIRRDVNLSSVRKHDAHYSSRRGPCCGRPVERHVLALRGRASEINGLFEHPVGYAYRQVAEDQTHQAVQSEHCSGSWSDSRSSMVSGKSIPQDRQGRISKYGTPCSSISVGRRSSRGS
jgi:hypothetical protein